MPTAWTPWLAAAWITKLPQPQPTSSTRSPSCSAELPADQLALGRLRLLERRAAALPSTDGFPTSPRASRARARTARSCRSSTRRGTARRTRSRRRSGGAPRARRARGCGARPRGRSSLAGIGGGAISPQARTAAKRQPQPRLRVDRGRLERVQQPDHAVEVVRLQLAGGIGAPQPELPGRAQQMGDGGRRAHREDRSAGASSARAPSRPRSAARTGAAEVRAPARGAVAQAGRRAFAPA